MVTRQNCEKAFSLLQEVQRVLEEETMLYEDDELAERIIEFLEELNEQND